MNNRGQGLSTNAIILIILGVAILVILIIGFTLGWKTLVPFIKSDNVDTVVKSCDTECSTQSKFSYCSKEKELNDGENEIKTTCHVLQKIYPIYGITPCSIDCELSCVDILIDEKVGEIVNVTTCPDDRKDVTAALKIAPSSGELCCIVK